MAQTQQEITDFLFRDLSEQTKSDKSKFFFKERAIDQWFDQLPLTNIQFSIKSIYQALISSNEQRVPYKQRLYLLEKIHTTIIDFADNLKKGNLHRKFPLDKKQQRVSTLIESLHRHTIIGYKYILRDLMACHSFILCPHKHAQTGLVIERIIRYYSLCLITNYQFYNAPIKGQWSNIYQLFIFAQQKKLLNKKITDPSLFLLKETTIQNTFLQIVLMAITDPYHISQTSIYALFNQLEEWSSLVEIRHYQKNDDKKALVIDLSTDEQPIFIDTKNISNYDFLFELGTLKLDVDTLLLSEKINLDAHLLNKISLSWLEIAKRKQSRKDKESVYINMAIGLNHAHSLFDNYAESEDLSEQDNNIPTLKNEDSENTLELINLGGTATLNDAFTENSAIVQKSSPVVSNVHLSTWKIINESPNGYSLLWDNSQAINVKVGKLIVLCPEKNCEKKSWLGCNKKTWLIGTIRWIKCVDLNKIQVGVYIIGNNPLAVSISKLGTDDEPKFRALLVPEIKALKQAKTLIISALSYKSGDELILHEFQMVDDRLQHIKTKITLLGCVDSSSHFLRFKYKHVDDSDNSDALEEFLSSKSLLSEPVTKNKQDEPIRFVDNIDEFDSVWDDL